jgi:hypothetical protein
MTTQHDKLKRWRPRFSVRTLLVIVGLLALTLAVFVRFQDRLRRRERIVAEVERLGGSVQYDYDYYGTPWDEPPGPAWARQLLGQHAFSDVVFVSFYYGQTDVSNDDLVLLRDLPNLVALP